MTEDLWGASHPPSKAMGSHESQRTATVTWLTPPEIIGALGPFDLDPCAAPDPRPWPTAARHVSRPDDGLAVQWEGRVWLNPPYNKDATTWMQRLADHGHGTALIFARTETAWFIDTVWHRATAALFLHGRIYFCRPNGKRAEDSAGAPSVLVAYGDYDAERLRGSELSGTYVTWERPERIRGEASLFDLAGTA